MLRDLHSSGRRGQKTHSINIECQVLLWNKLKLEVLREDRWGCVKDGHQKGVFVHIK